MLRQTVFLLGVCFFFGAYFYLPTNCAAQVLSQEERAALQAQYAELQREIAAQQQIIRNTQAKKNTLQGDVTLLNARIRAAQAQINAKNITIRRLSAQILKKNEIIKELSERIDRGNESLASILRQVQTLDDTTVVDIALGSRGVSEFFADLDAFVSIKTDLHAVFVDIRKAQAQTEREKAELSAKQDKTADERYDIEITRNRIASDRVQKQQLIAITRNQEARYKKILADRQARASEIRATLFPLRDAQPIRFDDALRLARKAQSRTGVRPALILAVLTQESNMGRNVGRCRLTDITTGAGINIGTGRVFTNVMSPRRDIQPFIDLSTRLGFDPLRQVVSCPIPRDGGFGGAMGPAQFIPSTWRAHEAQIARFSENAVPNPWSAEDAIIAMSIYLDHLGAGAGGYTAEHRASARYYAGSSWNTPAGRRYADNVLALASRIQRDIDFLASN